MADSRCFPVSCRALPALGGFPHGAIIITVGKRFAALGAQDKDHAILEFTAAHTVYQRVGLTGFRTFLKQAGRVTEPFADGLGKLSAGRSITLYEFYGHAEDFDQMRAFCEKAASKDFLLQKQNEARKLVQEITGPVSCRTANPVWDAYVRQSFLDNVLRGGFPYLLRSNGNGPITYLYSRKHGAPEREYNYFYLGKEYFSQGNGNFRDVCQNRRSDVWFQPEAGAYNRKLFFELLQPDGYNPLVVQPMRYRIRDFTAIQPLPPFDYAEAAKQFLKVPFTAGQLAMQAEAWKIADVSTFIAEVLYQAAMESSANFQEGYWSDHCAAFN